MADVSVELDWAGNTSPLPLSPITVNPFTIADVQKVAPIGVHIKELNQIAPLLVESLRVDHVRHIDPLAIERLDITHLPTVNISLSQLPMLDLNVRRVPPIAIALQQQFEMTSHYTLRTRLLGLEVMRMELTGKTKITPRDCSRREQSRSHERSFPDVAAAGNPAMTCAVIEPCAAARAHTAARPDHARRPTLNAGTRPFGVSLQRNGPDSGATTVTDSALRFGG